MRSRERDIGRETYVSSERELGFGLGALLDAGSRSIGAREAALTRRSTCTRRTTLRPLALGSLPRTLHLRNPRDDRDRCVCGAKQRNNKEAVERIRAPD